MMKRILKKLEKNYRVNEECSFPVAVRVAPEAAAAGGAIGDDEDFFFFAVDEAPRAPLHEVEASIDGLMYCGGAP